ncbi:MAG: hypothetical protein ACRDIB_10510, partial [Ardenticatenaceae bacterium]
HEAFMRLLTSILMGSSFPAGELQRVWPTLQQVATRIPLYQLTYPSGWQWLSSVQRAVTRAP